MMTAMPLHQERREDERSRIPPSATIYLALITAAAAAAAIPGFTHLHTGTHTWRNFAILTIAAAIAQVFKVETTRNQAMHAALVFAVPAVLLLPPGLIVLVAIATHIPEWLKERYPWFIQTWDPLESTCRHASLSIL